MPTSRTTSPVQSAFHTARWTRKPPHASIAARSTSSIATGSGVMHRQRARPRSRSWDFVPRNCLAGSIGGDATGIRWPPRSMLAACLQPPNSGSWAIHRSVNSPRSRPEFADCAPLFREERQRKPDDLEAQEGQRPIVIHALENLAHSDTGIVMLRRLLREQLQRIEQGLDPINTIREPKENKRIPTGAWNTILAPAAAGA